MMEKYGVDMSNLPMTDEQIRIIRELSKVASFEAPKNRKDAESIIEKLLNNPDTQVRTAKE